MCGRFYVDDEVARQIEKIARKIERETASGAGVPSSEIRMPLSGVGMPAGYKGDVRPSEEAWVLTAGAEVTARRLKWGYEFSGRNAAPERTGKTTGVIFNARSETVREKRMFREDFENRRCVIPAGKFYEWKHGGRGEREKYDFYRPSQLLYLAGVFHRDPEGDRFTVLTREAAGCMLGIHDRMPLLLEREEVEEWLFDRRAAGRLLERAPVKLERKKSGGEDYSQLSLFS